MGKAAARPGQSHPIQGLMSPPQTCCKMRMEVREVEGSNIGYIDTIKMLHVLTTVRHTQGHPNHTVCANHHKAACRLTISLLEVPSSSCGYALESCMD